MKHNNKKIGNLGEDIACKYLFEKGFDILDRNYSKKIGEIDIICFKSGVMHFIEVKTVSRETYQKDNNNVAHETINMHKPEENVDNRKIAKIERVSEMFLKEKGFLDKTFQIDAISVYLYIDELGVIRKCNIKYIPNANL